MCQKLLFMTPTPWAMQFWAMLLEAESHGSVLQSISHTAVVNFPKLASNTSRPLMLDLDNGLSGGHNRMG